MENKLNVLKRLKHNIIQILNTNYIKFANVTIFVLRQDYVKSHYYS